MSSTLTADFTLSFMYMNLVPLLKLGSPEAGATVKSQQVCRRQRAIARPTAVRRRVR
jgi:hypothetical protein